MARVKETIHLPELPGSGSASASGASAGDSKPGEPDLEAILSRLKNMPGMEGMMGNMKVPCSSWSACTPVFAALRDCDCSLLSESYR